MFKKKLSCVIHCGRMNSYTFVGFGFVIFGLVYIRLICLYAVFEKVANCFAAKACNIVICVMLVSDALGSRSIVHDVLKGSYI